MSTDLLWLLHAAFWTPFAVRLVVTLLHHRSPAGASTGTSHSAWIVLAHAAAMGVAYEALLRRTTPPQPWPAAAAGAVVIVLATGLAAWSLAALRSWRVIAVVDEGHELCTRGPYRLVRHPIYLSLGLVSLGTAIWVPHPQVVASAALTLLVGDWRARVEERVLTAHFDEPYRAYVAASHRFLPGLY